MTNTILLADDSVTIQKVIELTFMDEDYEVVAVGNGDEALDRLEEVTPDVVIADVHMPGASGYDVARRAKQLHPQAPVLLLVGTFEPFDEADYQASGADAYLKKPFDSQELLHRVSDLMEARAGAAAPAAAEPAAVEPAAPAVPAAAVEPAPPPFAEPPSAAATAAAASSAGALPPPPAAGGAETRFVPTWQEGAAATGAAAAGAAAWRPSDATEAHEEVEPLGTRRLPTFGAAEAAPPGVTSEPPAAPETAEAGEPGWSGWGIGSEPEEVAAPLEPSEEGEPVWPRGESFEPAWESVEAAAGEVEAAETPSWALEDTAEEGSALAAEPAAAPRPPAEPFPELSRPQPAVPAAGAEGPVSGVPGPASPSAAGDGREVRLSEADIDRVARRVAELLGDRVIREVAWEVVPDLAEVVIKDRLRELESQVD